MAGGFCPLFRDECFEGCEWNIGSVCVMVRIAFALEDLTDDEGNLCVVQIDPKEEEHES